MKKAILLALALGFSAGMAVRAAESEAKPLTPEQQQQRDAIIKKYDANSNGVLDKQEMKQLTKADKKALAKTGGVGTAKGKKEAAVNEEAAKVEKKSKEKPDKAPEAKPESKRRVKK